MRNLRNYREYTNSMMIDEFSIGNMLPQVPLSEKSNTEKPNKVVKNDKGQILPMDKINEKDTNTALYFVTKADMKSKTTLEPRIPQNFLTDNGFEDNKIERVCFSTSINGAVTALSQNLKNTDLFVYSPIGVEKRDIYVPSISQVPDRSITGEVWIRKPVQIECIGKIHVIDAKKNPQRYKYGNKIAELYEWNWKWIDKNINESVSSVYGAYDAHGKWNAAVNVDGKTYRYRVECLIINGNKVFVSLDKNGNLIIPGGSVEKDIDDITQVANECREEARINIKNPIYTGIDRIQGCPPHISKHKSVLPFEYDGSLSKVYVAEYDSDYNGYIDEYDKDEKMIRGKFVPIKDVVNRLKIEWREALNKYTNVYYRVTYNGEGIYNALKNNIPLNVWIGLLKSDAMRWLSKPPKYNESSRSYFTKEGFKMFMRKTYPVMRKYLNPEFVNIEEVRLPNKMMYSDKYQVVTESSETKYDPPYTYDEIVKNYGKDMAVKLVADPAHKFRCHTGIELIHKEPSLSELNRIHSNWQLMTDEQKRKSDMKSRELFGCDNETNYRRLVKTYNEACKDVKTARKFVSEVGKLAKKYDANYFIVTDGASGIHNNGNPAVKNARDSQVEWEKKHGFDPDEDWSDTLATESAKNNKGKVVPKKCPKCGSPVRIFLRGEPVFLCSNKKCGKFFGVVPFKESVELNDTIPPTSFISKCKMTKSFRKFSPDFYGARHDWYYNGDWVGGCIVVYNNTHEKKRIHDKLYNTESIYFYPGIWIDDLYVDEKYRGRGLARDICKLCISEYGVDHIACVRGNSVISLYKSLGFEVYKCEQDDLNYIYYMKMNGNVNESFETFVTTNPFENTIHLYHASHNQERLRTIKPLSKNFGSRVSSMRLSSFWAVDKNISLIMAIVKLIGSCGYDAQCLSKSRFAILNCDESEYDNIMSSLKDKVVWLYEKTMPKKYVKIGHDNIMEEYSIDIPVSPDKSTCYTFNDYKEFITRDKLVFFTTEFLQSKGKEWYKDFINNEMKIIRKENGRFLGNLMFKNYSTKSMMNKDFKSLNMDVNESVKRSKLPDDVFGIPQERKYPMPDKKHVISAIKLFNHVEPKYEEQLANKILENIDKYNIDISIIGEKNRLNKYIKESEDSTMENSLVKDLEFLYFEAGDPDIPDLIEPIVKQLESKGYQVKYASPGHINTTFDNDKNKDRVINSKMTSTARIIFSRDYHFKTTPQGWEWKILQNDSKALYVKPYTYNEKMGPKDEAFKKWQTFYISNIKSWVTDLPKAGSDAKTEPDVNF